MGFSLSPIIADIVTQDLETIAINELQCRFLMYFRYVDDISIAVLENNLITIHDKFNSIYEILKFTLEVWVMTALIL